MTPKTGAEVEAHYKLHYLLAKTQPTPDTSRAPLESDEEAAELAAWEESEGAQLDANLHARRAAAFERHVARVGPSGHAFGALSMGPSQSAPAEAPTAGRVRTGAPRISGPSAAQQAAGFMPLRGEFDVEWDNEAEVLLADLEFGPGRDGAPEPPEERALKLRVCALYNRKLEERDRRKAFVVSRGLLDFRRQQAADRKRPREERELASALRPFARLQSQKEHAEFVRGLLTELRLRRRIDALRQYRAAGLKTLAEAELFDKDRRARESGGRAEGARQSAKGHAGQRPLSSGVPSVGTTAGAGRVLAAAVPHGESAVDHLLSAHEQDLCSALGLQAGQYAYMKRVLVTECARRGFLRRDDATALVRIDARRLGNVYDFCVHAGWLNDEPPPSTEPSPAAADELLVHTFKLPQSVEGPATTKE